MALVIKYNGKKALKTKCKYISGNWYEINVDCFKVDGRWNRIDNGLIFFNYSTNTWEKKSNYDKIYKCIVGKKKDGEYIIGEISDTSVSPTLYDLDSDKSYYILNTDLAKSLGFIDVLNNTFWYNRKPYDGWNNKKGIDAHYSKLPYTADKQIERYSYYFDTYYKHNVNTKLRNTASLLKGYKWGIEFETSNGFIKPETCLKHGLIPLKDGSLRKENGFLPFEYTTIPLSGIKGLSNIIDICDILQERCTFDNWSSLHIHLSGLEKTAANIVSLYKLLYMIQDEMFSMFAPYKTNPVGVTKDDKNYCQKLEINIPKFKISDKNDFKEMLNSYFSEIFHFVSCGYYPDDRINLSLFRHPANTDKWNINSRYYWCNLVPFLFNKDSSRTVEFRLHTPTFNSTKVVNWLMICKAILEYVKLEGINILVLESITLNEILNRVYCKSIYGLKVYKILTEYIEFRKLDNLKAKKSGDSVNSAESKLDFTFKMDKYFL